MSPTAEKEPSQLTKVLVKRIHGGRKQQSKFWQSEFSNLDNDVDIDIEIPTKTKFLGRKS